MTDNLLQIIRPDDFHLHVRDGKAMRSVILDTARQFGRAIIMPNLVPPVTSVQQAARYRHSILDALPDGTDFTPLMTLYLTDRTDPDEIVAAHESGFIHAVKLYPAGATTHSDAGVTDIKHIYPVLETLSKVGMPLLIHGEVTDPAVDVFDRERVFIETILSPLINQFPDLKIVMEHITTKEAVQFVVTAPENIAATLTVHHLLMNRNAIFTGGIRPHHYCLPVLKREEHRQALLEAAISGNPKFFLGTDSAPHPQHAKESACGCAGIYTAHTAMELYAEVFDQAHALDRLEGFTSLFGARFYGLPQNPGTLRLKRERWTIPESLPLGTERVIPFRAGDTCQWKVIP